MLAVRSFAISTKYITIFTRKSSKVLPGQWEEVTAFFSRQREYSNQTRKMENPGPV
jgi:hypothetical protein